ncbi:MAG: DUF3017 domain-containing protein [Actinomycetota bacterium]|nr:DUF3017 domain-containing protein [Actinomycetota bacterium]
MSLSTDDAASPPPPRAPRVLELPVLATLGLVVAGLLLTGMHHWRTGVELVGLGVLLGAALRLTLPARQAGLLVVRGRAFDAAVLLVLGFALVLLAGIIPTG